jgi:transcriptional regulator with XRE-family HTH domain
MNLRDFGQRVYRFRMAKKWTQDVCADRAGICVRTLQKVEGYKGAPAVDTVERLAEVFGCSFEELLRCQPTNRPLNIVGPNVRHLRNERGLSQEGVAIKCQLNGWDITREGIAKIEGQVRHVDDYELVSFCRALGVNLETLLPVRPSSLNQP